MDFVDHDLEIDGPASLGIDRLRGVAEDTDLDVAAPSRSVSAQWIVALVAGRCRDDLPDLSDRRSVRNKVRRDV